jgi:hypothetical protein
MTLEEFTEALRATCDSMRWGLDECGHLRAWTPQEDGKPFSYARWCCPITAVANHRCLGVWYTVLEWVGAANVIGLDPVLARAIVEAADADACADPTLRDILKEILIDDE